ncbi:MAG: beta-propeller fold lactonase family protein, partial [Chthonomonadales bacterium]
WTRDYGSAERYERSVLPKCNWMPKTASFAVFQTVSTKPADFVGNNSTAEIFIDPTGKFVYGSNRGDNSLACFAIDPAKGTLTLVGHTPTQGKIPRSFMMDPSGTFLIAVNQESNDLYVFKRNIKSGELTLTESSAFVNRPVCVIFVPK